MRVAHFSDLHYAGATLTEVDRCFSFAVDAAIARGVDCAVISGDSTDHALEVHAPAVEALARNIRRLADHCPVLMLHGTFSHEPPGVLNVFRLLGGRFRRPRRRPAAAGGAHRGRPLAGIAGLALRADPAGRAGAVFLRADGEQGRCGRGGGCHRSGRKRWASN